MRSGTRRPAAAASSLGVGRCAVIRARLPRLAACSNGRCDTVVAVSLAGVLFAKNRRQACSVGIDRRQSRISRLPVVFAERRRRLLRIGRCGASSAVHHNKSSSDLTRRAPPARLDLSPLFATANRRPGSVRFLASPTGPRPAQASPSGRSTRTSRMVVRANTASSASWKKRVATK